MMKKRVLFSLFAVALYSAGVTSCKKVEKQVEVNSTEIDENTAVSSETEENQIDPQIMEKAKYAVKDFPTVNVENVNGVLTLTGDVSKIQAKKIKQSMDASNIGEYENNLVIK